MTQWIDVPIRKGGWVEWVEPTRLPSGALRNGLGKVLSIDGEDVTVDCIYNGKVVVKKQHCEGVLGGY